MDRISITMEKGVTKPEWHRYLETNYGRIVVVLMTLGGKPGGSVKLPRALGNPYIDDALDALSSLILAHACAGVDVESEAYVEGVNTALDAIANRD